MKFPTNHALLSDRCRLRYISKEDIPEIFAASRYPGFTDGMRWEPPESEDELIAPYENNIKAWQNDTAYCFTIETIDPISFVGRIVIRKQKEPNVWDLGFWTHPERQSQGFMSEAVKTLLAFGFLELQAARIEAGHALWNKASERVLKKNGMNFIRRIPQGFQKRGKWIEENLLGIDLDNWQARRPTTS